MNLPWDKIFDLITNLLNNCESSVDGRVDALMNQPVRRWIATGNVLRDLGYKGIELSNARREVIAKVKGATTEQVRAFATGGSQALLALEDAA